MKNIQVVLKSRPGVKNNPQPECFSCEECDYPNITEDDVIIQTLYLSIDPALRGRMNETVRGQFLDTWPLNRALEGLGGVGLVVQSSCQAYKSGCIVEAAFGWPWKLYFSANSCEPSLRLSLKEMNPKLVRKGWLTYPLSCLGMVGITAYLSIQESGRPCFRDTCVVTDAAGPCGSLVGQIAGILGCRNVIGICEGDNQVKALRELGVTASINADTESVRARLKELCPSGINAYYDNCGGDISNKVILQMKPRGRVVVYEHTSHYNALDGGPLPPLSNDADFHVDMEEISRERFLPLSYEEKWNESLQTLTKWLLNGEIKVKETVYCGLESVGTAFADMMNGSCLGSVIVKVSDLDTPV